MRYKVVCVKEFRGIRSDGQMTNIARPVVDAVYTVVGERVDGMGVLALLLAEMHSKAGYNSEHFRPLEPGDLQYESVEEVLELTGSISGGNSWE
jgi:hypothetical protein